MPNDPDPGSQNLKRVTYLDGVRGLACLQVVLCHYANCFTPATAPRLGFAENGQAAVALFFLISGYVLAGAFKNAPRQMLATAVARAVRLFIPALASVVIAAALAEFARDYDVRATVAAGWPLPPPAVFGGLPADLDGISLIFGFNDTGLFKWAWLPPHKAAMNFPLWTMSVELWGSFAVLAAVWMRARFPTVFIPAFALALAGFFRSPIELFLIGYACAVWVPPAPRTKISLLAGAALITAGILFSGPSLRDGAFAAGPCVIFAGLLGAPAIQGVFDLPLFRFLGRISFPIYLLHYPILKLFGSIVFVMCLPYGPTEAMAAAMTLGLSLTIPLSMLFGHYCDAPAIGIASRLKRHLIETWGALEITGKGRISKVPTKFL